MFVCAWRKLVWSTREQFTAPGKIYCISPKMADAGESMGVYIRESIPRGSTAMFTISEACTTVTSSLTNIGQAHKILMITQKHTNTHNV